MSVSDLVYVLSEYAELVILAISRTDDAHRHSPRKLSLQIRGSQCYMLPAS